MATFPNTLALPRTPLRGSRLAVGTGLLLALLMASAFLAVAFDSVPVPAGLAFVGGLAFIGYVLLALWSFDTAVAIGFLLSGIVLIEPAPPDGAFSVLIAIALVSGRVHVRRSPRSILVAIAVLITLNVLSTMEAVSVPVALRFAFITLYLLAFAVWLTGYLVTRHRVRILVIAWLVIAVGTTIVGLLAWQLPIPTRTLWLTSDLERVKGLFKDPNVYGPFLVPITMIVLDQQMRPRLLKLRTSVSLLILAILVLGILAAFSRAAWGNAALAFVVTLGTAMLARRGRGRALKTLLGVVVVGSVAFAVLGATGQLTFLHERAHIQSYDTDRFAAQHAGYELGWSHPVGVGPGQFQFHHNVETHSTYVRTLAEQGFGGLACWIAILLITFVVAAGNALRGWDTFGIGAGALLGSWCGLVLNSAVVDTLHWRHLWVVAALIWAGAANNRRAEAAQRRSSSSVMASTSSSAVTSSGRAA
jgi:hypothetical protein